MDAARALSDRITDHLYTEGFRDDLMYVHTTTTYDGRVMISLFPYDYDCETCRAKGFVPKLVEAFKQRLAPTWCNDCRTLTDERWTRTRELTPRLKTTLERAFTVDEVSPGSQFTSFTISP